MDQLIVHLDDQDHLMGEDETTVCGIPVPHGTTTVSEPASPCPQCYPESKPKKGKAKSGDEA